MRTLSSTLLKAQQAGALNPLYKIVLTKGTTTYTYGKERILPSEHDEEPYSHRATIVLDNHDGALDDKDLKGFKGVLSYGVITTAGEEYSATAPVWVIDQQFDSDPNKLICTLELEGAFNLMAEDEASTSYVPDEDDETTVKQLADGIIKATLAPFSACKAYEVVWDEGYDPLADTYKPKDGFRIYTRGKRLAALRRVLDYTANVARWGADGKVHILKPVTSGTTYDYEYSLETGHKFFSKAYRNSLVIPNKIYVKSYDDDDPQYLGVAATEGYDSLPAEVKKVHYIQMKLETNDQADDLAEALIAKAEMWCKRGAAEVPLNVGAEVFDYVKVTDSRQGDTRTGNLGYVHRRFGKDKWTMTFGFGNWLDMLRYRQILKELETYTDAGQYFNRLSVKNLYAENIVAENCDFVWLDPDNTIDLSKIGDTLDNLPDGEVYARVKSLHLDAGQVKLDEHIIYKPGYNPTTKFDLGTDDLDDIPEGTVYRRAKSAALTADGLVILDQVVVGTYGLIRSTDISAGHIKLDTVVTGTYGLVLSADISAGHILLSSVTQSSSYQTATAAQKTSWTNKPENMDQIGEGTTYQRVRATQIDAGNLKLTSATVKSGEWYDVSGVEIDAAHGINIYGANNALTTRATKTGTIQCYVGSDGAIYAGAGAIKLHSGGLEVNGQYMKFKYGGNTIAEIYADSSGLEIAVTDPYSVLMLRTPANKGIRVDFCSYITLPQKTSAQSPASEGMLIYNPNTGYTNVYHAGAWHHLNRDAGWA